MLFWKHGQTLHWIEWKLLELCCVPFKKNLFRQKCLQSFEMWLGAVRRAWDRARNFKEKKFCTGIQIFPPYSRRFKESFKSIKKIDFPKLIQWSYPLRNFCFSFESNGVINQKKWMALFNIIIWHVQRLKLENDNACQIDITGEII